ncbi:MAG: efflux RND transporter periplasmic adaptor subunit [Gemmatimonadota bacterium]|nr:MAG: efflux RND transporter periplasmic adaptor subunit [Gemmatimonadota bacterium]
MNKLATSCAAMALLLAACGTEEPADSPMAGMSAEEHAMHMGGGGGTTDSSGATVRSMVALTTDQQRALGVVYAPVTRGALTRRIRTVGSLAAPEPNVVDVAPKIDGFIEELHVASTGQPVTRGQPLLRLYSPLLVSAQDELLTARRLYSSIDPSAEDARARASQMLDAARRRLEYWDITPEQIQLLEETGEVTKTLTLVSPVDGVVLDKSVVEGQRVMAGMRLYQLADLTEMWIDAEIFEQDMQHVAVGSMAHMEVAAYPGKHVMGRVSFVHPTVDPAARTNRVRVSVDNSDLQLKPGMFVTVYFDVSLGDDLLSVPLDAVLFTGERNIVFVRHDDGTLMAHDVTLGSRAGDRVQILSGVSEGLTVVASANFLVDAESRIGGTGGTMAGMDHGDHQMTPPPDSAAAEHEHHD